MSNLVQRDPYAIDVLLDDLFKGYFVRPMRMSGDQTEMRMIKMDVRESDQVLRRERYYGKVYRNFALGQEVAIE